jgi:hypothetical protein
MELGGFINAKLCTQGLFSNVREFVAKLFPGFHIILRDNCCPRYAIVADFGAEPLKTIKWLLQEMFITQAAPHLWVRTISKRRYVKQISSFSARW